MSKAVVEAIERLAEKVERIAYAQELTVKMSMAGIDWRTCGRCGCTIVSSKSACCEACGSDDVD